MQLESLRTGKPSPLSIVVSSSASLAQSLVANVGFALRDAVATVQETPRLYDDNRRLAAENRALQARTGRLEDALAVAPEARANAETAAGLPGSVAASVIGYDPENVSRSIELDRGSIAGIKAGDGVVNGDGVVGRVTDVAPLTSTVLLVIDPASKVPALVARGRWWGIATGTTARVALRYVSQDAKLRSGDRIVTGRGRSFEAGMPIGRIVRVDHPEGALYQTAIVEPAVAFGRLERVVVVPPQP